jgi:hypothetical protein
MRDWEDERQTVEVENIYQSDMLNSTSPVGRLAQRVKVPEQVKIT